MALQVIGAGFGRTGTLTLKAALEILGFGPYHHMIEDTVYADQLPFWNRASRGEPFEWADVFGAYRSTMDWPGCHFHAELTERYPDARVILMLRDPERWYDSMSETILASMAQMGLAAPMADDHPVAFEAGDRCKPLCDHLGMGMPDEDFPQMNDRKEIRSHAQSLKEVSGISARTVMASVHEPAVRWTGPNTERARLWSLTSLRKPR